MAGLVIPTMERMEQAALIQEWIRRLASSAHKDMMKASDPQFGAACHIQYMTLSKLAELLLVEVSNAIEEFESMGGTTSCDTGTEETDGLELINPM